MNRWSRLWYQPNLPLGQNGARVTASGEHIALSKNAALEGMVLLKNERSALPIARGAKIALFGKGTFDYVKGGGGSGDVTVPYIRNLYEGFSQYPDRVTTFAETNVYYRAHVEAQYAAGRVPGMVEEPELPEELLRRAAAYADTAVITISRFSGEGWDRKCAFDKLEKHVGVEEQLLKVVNELFPKGDFVLTDAEEAMVNKVKRVFSKVVVVLNVGSVFDTSFFRDDDRIQGALMAWQGGIEGGLAAAELLLGLANPSGRLSDTFACTLEDYPSSPTFYESDDYVDYVEDIYVGYRYFETIPGAKGKVSYPFGYGLSYTSFEWTQPQGRLAEDKIELTTTVTNVGAVPGRDVVQAYYSAPQGKLGKPAMALAGYCKTRLLQPGESQRVTIAFSPEEMASYDDLGKVWASAWLLEAGEYRFWLGKNVREVCACEYTLTLNKDRVVQPLTRRMAPTALRKRLLADGTYEALPVSEGNDPNANGLARMAETDMEFPIPAVRARPARQYFAPSDRHSLLEVAEGSVSMDEFIAQLSDEDLAWLLGGQPNTGVANTFGYGNLPEYGVPNAMSADGPAGVRIQPQVGVCTTAFPCATLLACTWDPAVTEAVGRAAGAELKENNLAVWLAPAINIHRNPLCGRNFEYYSEDPLLTAKQAGALVRGVQQNGVGATIKHFALNNKETNRKNSDSRASERAIREIYIRAFQRIIQEADPWSLMTSYNIINGHRASENADLLNGILREEWGYTGMVTTDWWTYAENYKEVAAGNDVKMGVGYPERLLEAKEKGLLTRAQMETAAKRILGLILKLD
ncbi:MAG: glycoside hydrolase family 3 C-terminal domain-containing protein [Clostridia bacterium]|nr:glycoside hydrolase family 3 C-terminal domain-containing protein [Clostridia bacterium]